MNTRADQVLSDALAPAPEHRSLVVLSLLDSLQGDDVPEESVTKSWVVEACKRSDDVRAKRVAAIPLNEFRSWLNAL